MCRKRLPSTNEQVVNEHVELPPCDQFWIELTDGSSRRVSWICKSWFAGLFAFGVRSLKHVERDENLATNLEWYVNPLRSRVETQRNAANRAGVLRHIFADTTVAARHAASQHSVLVLQRER